MIVDLAIVAFIGFFVWRGLHRGLVAGLVRLAGFIVATVTAVAAYPIVAPALRGLGLSGGLADLAAAVLVFVGVMVAAAIGGRALTRVLNWTKWGLVNKAGGAAVAGVSALALVTLVVLAMSVAPSDGPRNLIASSTLARGIASEAPEVLQTVARTDLRALVRAFDPAPEVKLAATADFRVFEGGARELFARVNRERAARDLAPLRWDDALAAAGRDHAADMYRRGYFGHDTPEGATPAARLRARGVRFRLVGENLALAGSIDAAHAQLMRSERHREHILGTRFTRLGIAVMYGAQGLLVAQEFAA